MRPDLWLQELEVLTEQDIENVKTLKDLRDTIAHELPRILWGEPEMVKTEHVRTMQSILQKTDRFWGQVAVDTNPNWDGKEVDSEGITSLRYLMFDYLTHFIEEEIDQRPPETLA